MFKKCVISAIAFAALGTTAGHAGTATVGISGGFLNVTANVSASCQAAQSAPVAFGTITSLASAVNTTGTISVTCDNGVPYAVGLNPGNNFSAASGLRQMSGSFGGVTYYLPYQLYVDAAHTTAFTDLVTGTSGSTTGSPTASTPGATGTGLAQTLTVYAQVPAGVKPPPATFGYSDSVAITVGY